MEIKKAPQTIMPPRMTQSLIKGFNAVANHAYLIIFPLLLDLFIWFGPVMTGTHSLSTFMKLFEQGMQEQLQQPEVIAQFKSIQPALNELIGSFNLFGFLNTMPIGIPSLMAFQNVTETPLGLVQKLSTTSIAKEFAIFLLIIVAGSILGAIFISEIGRICNLDKTKQTFSIKNLLMNSLWLVLLNFAIWGLIVLVLFPSMTIVVLLTMINATIGNIANFVVLLLLFWMIIPLLFTPHAVVIQQTNPLKAMLSSIRLIRFYLPGTGFFVLFSLLLYQGLNQFLWLQPVLTSYMLLGGIFGHAFISTGLLASSFFYYQDGLTWMNHNLKMIAQQTNQPDRPFQA